jgi:hypothetical protein
MSLLLLMAATGLTGQHPGAPVPVDVAQVVLEKMVADASPDLVLCIDLNGSDPPTKVLARLQRPDRTIVSGSQCHRATDGGDHPSYYGDAHRPAHFLAVSRTIRISQTDLTVQAVESYHMKWASFWTVRLTRNDSGWHIVSFHLDAMA